MVVNVTNNGNSTVQNVQLTTATLGAASGATLPASLGDIQIGQSASVLLTFPSSTGADGAGVIEKLTGTYTGGTFGGSFRGRPALAFQMNDLIPHTNPLPVAELMEDVTKLIVNARSVVLLIIWVLVHIW